MTISTIILDDEPLAVDLLRDYTQKFERLSLEEVFYDPMQALSYLRDHTIDLVFLDIEMPRLTGIELSRLIPDTTVVIFTTAHRDYAVEAFDVKAVDYLLKPISFSRFSAAIEKATGMLDRQKQEVEIIIRADRRDHLLKANDILYLEGLKDYVQVFTTRGKLVSRGSLGTILKRNELSFLERVHKSFAVNPHHITSRSADGIYINELFIPVGPTYG